jgi:hypothetical protein
MNVAALCFDQIGDTCAFRALTRQIYHPIHRIDRHHARASSGQRNRGWTRAAAYVEHTGSVELNVSGDPAQRSRLAQRKNLRAQPLVAVKLPPIVGYGAKVLFNPWLMVTDIDSYRHTFEPRKDE